MDMTRGYNHVLNESRRRFLRFISLMVAVTTLILATLGFTSGDMQDGTINIILSIMPLTIHISLRDSSRLNFSVNTFLIYLFVVMIVTVQTLDGDIYDSVWLLLYPVVAMMLKGAKTGAIISVCYTVIISFLFLFQITTLPISVTVNTLLILTLITIMSYYYEYAREMNYKRLEVAVNDADQKSEMLREISIHDELTGAFNRRYFNEIFPRELNRNLRESSIMGFFILDLDYFKQYNDAYGHQMGDEALSTISKTIQNQLRRGGDYIFRLGGEEFGGILQDESEEKLLGKVTEICDSIRELNIKHLYGGKPKCITTSIGLRILTGTENSAAEDAVYRDADQALYRAKDLGRNQVVVYQYKYHTS